jgi:hypothetical protein
MRPKVPRHWPGAHCFVVATRRGNTRGAKGAGHPRRDGVNRVELNTQNHTPKGAPFYIASVKEECLGKLILLGEGSLRRALRHYEAHYHEERNHQGKNNVLLFPLPTQAVRREQEKVRCRERLGGLLKYYEREAA